MVFTLRAAAHPATIPTSLASLGLVQGAAQKFGWTVYDMIHKVRWVGNQLLTIKKVYEVFNIPNVVPDGDIPFPEDAAQSASAILA